MITSVDRGTFRLNVGGVDYCVDGELGAQGFDFAISPKSVWVLENGQAVKLVNDTVLREKIVAEVMAWGKSNGKRITLWE